LYLQVWLLQGRKKGLSPIWAISKPCISHIIPHNLLKFNGNNIVLCYTCPGKNDQAAVYGSKRIDFEASKGERGLWLSSKHLWMFSSCLKKAIAGSAAKRHAWSLPLRFSTVIGR
jgi:hypothetical protein